MASPTAPRTAARDASRGGRSTEEENRKPSASGRITGFKEKKKCEQSTRTKTPSPSGPAGVEGGGRELTCPFLKTAVCPAALLPGLPPRLSHGPPQPEPEPEPPRSLSRGENGLGNFLASRAERQTRHRAAVF